MADESATPYGYLVDALNFLLDETGIEVLSMTFSKSDIPIDWDEDTNRWIERDCG